MKRSWYLWPGPSSIIHTHHFTNHRREEDRETYRRTIGDVDSAKVRSAVGLCWRSCLGYQHGRCQCGYFVALPPTAARTLRDGSSIVGFVKRSWYLWPGPSSIIHTHHFTNHRREEDRETYRRTIGDVDSAKVRSAVGLCWRSCLGYQHGRCQCGYFVALPPTAARTLRIANTTRVRLPLFFIPVP